MGRPSSSNSWKQKENRMNSWSLPYYYPLCASGLFQIPLGKKTPSSLDLFFASLKCREPNFWRLCTRIPTSLPLTFMFNLAISFWSNLRGKGRERENRHTLRDRRSSYWFPLSYKQQKKLLKNIESLMYFLFEGDQNKEVIGIVLQFAWRRILTRGHKW